MNPTFSNKMNLLLGVHQLFPQVHTGTEVLTLELARGMRRLGHHVEILAGAPERNVSERERSWMTQDDHDGFLVHRLHYGVGQHREPISYDLTVIDRICLVRELVSQRKPDVVHFNHVIGFSARVIPEIHEMGIPVIFTPTDYWIICPAVSLFRTYEKRPCDGPEDAVNCVRCYKPVPRLAAKLAMRIGRLSQGRLRGNIENLYALGRRVRVLVDDVNAADKILPATKFLADILIRHGVDGHRVSVVPYGIDIGNLPDSVPVPKKFSETTPLRVGFIGTLSEMKGPHVVVDALSLMGERNNAVVLDIYGKLDGENPYCKKLLKKVESIRGIVHFRGLFPNEIIGEVLRGLHLLVIPSLWYESTPLVLCSALRAGTPVLVSRLGGLTEAVNEGVNGFSFPVGDGHALSEIISNILDDPEMLIKIRSHFEVRYRSTSDYAKEVESEYLKVLTPGDWNRKVIQ
jgi:glycosyltransferase involved in cell wall biosynthesis